MNSIEQQLGQLQAASNYGAVQGQTPRKSWAESPIEEKLERLRQELLDARRTQVWDTQRMGRVDSLLYRLEHHQHGVDGTVVVRIQDTERGFGEAAQSLKATFDPLA